MIYIINLHRMKNDLIMNEYKCNDVRFDEFVCM